MVLQNNAKGPEWNKISHTDRSGRDAPKKEQEQGQKQMTAALKQVDADAGRSAKLADGAAKKPGVAGEAGRAGTTAGTEGKGDARKTQGSTVATTDTPEVAAARKQLQASAALFRNLTKTGPQQGRATPGTPQEGQSTADARTPHGAQQGAATARSATPQLGVPPQGQAAATAPPTTPQTTPPTPQAQTQAGQKPTGESGARDGRTATRRGAESPSTAARQDVDIEETDTARIRTTDAEAGEDDASPTRRTRAESTPPQSGTTTQAGVAGAMAHGADSADEPATDTTSDDIDAMDGEAGRTTRGSGRHVRHADGQSRDEGLDATLGGDVGGEAPIDEDRHFAQITQPTNANDEALLDQARKVASYQREVLQNPTRRAELAALRDAAQATDEILRRITVLALSDRIIVSPDDAQELKSLLRLNMLAGGSPYGPYRSAKA